MTETPLPPRRIEYVLIDEVNTADRNPRTHATLQKVKGSMKRYGFVESAIHDARTDKIIAGHGRQQGLLEMHAAGEEPPEGIMVDPDGRWRMPLTYGWASKNDDEAETLLVNLNRLAEQGGWETESLAELLDELRASSPDDFELTGFDDADVDGMLADLASSSYDELEEPGDLDDAPAAPHRPEAKTTEGEVWVIGRHRLAVGDSTDPEVVREALDGAPAQLVFTDPPYGVSYEGQGGMKIINDELSVKKLGVLLEGAFKVMQQVLIPGGAFYICTSDLAEGTFRNSLQAVGLQMRQQVVWVKDSLVLGRKDYHYQHEAILYGEQEGEPALVPPPEEAFETEHETMLYGWHEGAAHEFEGGRKQTTVWLCPKPRRSDLHPTMKPVALVRRAIMNSSKPGSDRGRVLDLFGGSGSTMVAAETCGRSSSLVELDPPYADVILERMHDLFGLDGVREPDGARWSEIRG